MKILLCTPYKNDPNIVRGGINQWGQNILSYYKISNDEVELLPVSFDRHSSRIGSDNILIRIINGVKDQIKPIITTVKSIIKDNPDVIHICTSAGLGCLRDYILVIIAKHYNVNSVLHLHFGRLPELAIEKNWEWRILKNVMRHCDMIIPMNKSTELTLYNNGFKNVKYLPNPLSNLTLERISKLENKTTRINKKLLYVGHVYKTKGVVELVKGCLGIEGIKLKIVGKYTKEIYDELISISNSSNNGDWLEFAGELPYENVIEEFLSSDIFVFPSYTEGFPNVILEAMACGCPIVASSVGAIPEMLDIDNDPCGICITPKKVDELSDAVIALINDRQKKDDFSVKAKKRVNTFYGMPVVWDQLVSIWGNTNK